MAHALVSDKAV
jgi:hypothetical protein